MLSFFPRDVLDEILNLIESVSEDFPSYFFNACLSVHSNIHEDRLKRGAANIQLNKIKMSCLIKDLHIRCLCYIALVRQERNLYSLLRLHNLSRS